MENSVGKVRAICISEERGVEKKEVESAELIVGEGIKGDAHAGKWHRQVSILSGGRVDEFNRKGVIDEQGRRKQAFYVLKEFYCDN